ncbi:MAG: CotH kinase family protein [Paludibacteraceae bacterium]
MQIKWSIGCLLMMLCACTRDISLPNHDVQPGDTVPNVVDAGLSYDVLFDIEHISAIHLQLTADDWNTLLGNFDVDWFNNVYVPATFVYEQNGTTYTIDSVGVRLRGNTSRRRPEGTAGEEHNALNPDWHHAHYQVKFDEFRDKQRFVGCDRLVLKWFKDDAAYCREIYSYDLFRRFGVWMAPRACYTRLSLRIDDEQEAYFGVYALIEGVSKPFLKQRMGATHWSSDDGNLWKASWGATLSPESLTDANIGISVATMEQHEDYIYDLKTNKKTGFDAAKTQLQEFVTTLNGLKSGSVELQNYLEEHVAVDMFLRAYAVNVMVGMWDDYWYNNGANYYFYFDTDGKFYFIPYDYDNTLGTSNLMSNSGTQDLLNWGSLGSDRVLMRKVMSITEYKERYKLYIKELASPSNDYFYTDNSIERIRAWHAMISPYVANDTGEDMIIDDVPASWGNCPFYRLLSGNEQGGADGEANWFRTKIHNINF